MKMEDIPLHQNMSVPKANSLPRDSGTNFSRHFKNVIGMEIQHRLDAMNKLGVLPDVVQRFFIDEKPHSVQLTSSLREITVVPELHYLLRGFCRVFDLRKTMENIPYWILVRERSVWPLFPILWSRCAIEFALDDLSVCTGKGSRYRERVLPVVQLGGRILSYMKYILMLNHVQIARFRHRAARDCERPCDILGFSGGQRL